MKKVLVLGAAVAFLCATGLVTMTMAEEDKGPAEITLQTEAAKKPALFPHAAHQERGVECKTCHESANYAKGAWTKDAGHKLCKDCHKAEKAPTKCGACHPKKK